ncbi:MAG: amidohydrolase family protein [Armatimonadota bacterium]
MQAIDFHVHCFADGIAEKAVAAISGNYRIRPAYDGTEAGLLRMMDESGIDRSVVLPIATKPEQVPVINDWVLGLSPRLVPFGAVHPEYPGMAEEVSRMPERGIRGFKFQPNWQNCAPDNPRMFPIYEAAEGRMIAVFHSGEELVEMTENLATPEAAARVHAAFPSLTMVVAHLGGFCMWDEVEEHLLGRGVYLDISCCFPSVISDERLVRMIRAHGVERVLFGSDAPCAHPKPQLDRLLSLPLTDAEKEQIAWRNAERLLK